MVMTWTQDELGKVARADELRISSVRSDSTMSSPRTIWVVRHGDDLYVRSVNGPTAAWYQGTQRRHQGHIEGGGVSRDVTFTAPEPGIDEQLDDEYRAKYDRYPARIVNSILTAAAHAATVKLVPR